MLKPTLVLCLALACAPAFANPVSVSPGRIREHVKILASDLMEGRGTGQPGGDRAADYIASQFSSYGLLPAGDSGSFFQKVALVGITTLAPTTFAFQTPNEQLPLTLLDDYVANNQSQQSDVTIDAPIVFVGFGIDSATNQWNDYKDVDLHGKVALLFVNEPVSDDPKFFGGKALTYSGRWTYKFEETARRGAVATLIIHRTDLASYGWEVVRNSWGSEHSYLAQPTGARGAGGGGLKAACWIQQAVAKKLVAECGQDLDQLYHASQSRDFHPVELGARLRAHLVSRVRPFSSRNVLAVLAGSDPKLHRQAVMYSAHYDHLGIVDHGKDKIYNGAIDNATGCAVVLELARVWSRQPLAPARSLLFACTTAEEQGLLGAAFLAQHPPCPASQISLDLNFDSMPPWGEPQEVVAVGSDRTDFRPTLEGVAAEMGLKVAPEAHPETGGYFRMDHFSLAQRGIPAFSIGEGLQFKGKTREWGEQQLKNYVTNDYHHPSDEFHPDWDFRGLATIVEFSFALGLEAASQRHLVQWLPGDEFAREP